MLSNGLMAFYLGPVALKYRRMAAGYPQSTDWLDWRS